MLKLKWNRDDNENYYIDITEDMSLVVSIVNGRYFNCVLGRLRGNDFHPASSRSRPEAAKKDAKVFLSTISQFAWDNGWRPKKNK